MAPNTNYTSEVARQQEALDRLPKDYNFPLFNTKHALLSQRSSGYKNTAMAAREIVDNSLEAGATRIDVVLQRPQNRRKHQLRDTVTDIAFIDNGSGMLPKMAQFAMSWGGGTHFDEHDFIGKFGFGLPNASINQTRLVSVFTKTEGSKNITRVTLDIDKFSSYEHQSVPEPVEDELPSFVTNYLQANELTFDHGTVVVWHDPDRLSYRKAGPLRDLIIDDFGAAYRNFLSRVTIIVDRKEVEPVDPLFLDPDARLFLPEEKGGAIEQHNRTIPVMYIYDKETESNHLRKIEDETDLENEKYDVLSQGNIQVIIARFPVGLAVSRKGKKGLNDANRRFAIRQTRRGMCFVRAGREIQTLDAFPRGANDESSGLGTWPLLQGYAYHWGIEVRFNPELDDAFGITNDKQTVRPIEDFWRVLTNEKVDDWVRQENAYQTKARKLDDGEKAEKRRKSEAPSGAEKAAAAVETITGRPTKAPSKDQKTIDEKTKKAVEKIAKSSGKSVSDVKKAIATQRKRQPFIIKFINDKRAPFYEPEWGVGAQIIIKLNKAHPFYTVLYTQVSGAQYGTLARDGIDLMLYALAQSELGMENEESRAFYQRQREDNWSKFLFDAMRILGQSGENADNDVNSDTEEQDAA